MTKFKKKNIISQAGNLTSSFLLRKRLFAVIFCMGLEICHNGQRLNKNVEVWPDTKNCESNSQRPLRAPKIFEQYPGTFKILEIIWKPSPSPWMWYQPMTEIVDISLKNWLKKLSLRKYSSHHNNFTAEACNIMLKKNCNFACCYVVHWMNCANANTNMLLWIVRCSLQLWFRKLWFISFSYLKKWTTKEAKQFAPGFCEINEMNFFWLIRKKYPWPETWTLEIEYFFFKFYISGSNASSVVYLSSLQSFKWRVFCAQRIHGVHVARKILKSHDPSSDVYGLTCRFACYMHIPPYFKTSQNARIYSHSKLRQIIPWGVYM